MARDIYDLDIRDTNTYTKDIETTDDEPLTLLYSNTLDQSVTVNVYGTYASDDDFSDAVSIVSGKSVSSGGSSSDSVTTPYDQIRVEVSAGTAPTSGSFVSKMMV